MVAWDTNGIATIEFKASIVAFDTGKVVTGLFDGIGTPECVGLLLCNPDVALDLAQRIVDAVRAGQAGSLQ